MSFAELKTMVNSKLPGQNGFKTIDKHIEDVKTKLNQNYGDNFYVYTPYLNSVNVFTAPSDGFRRDFTIRQFVDNRDTDIVLCDVVKEGILYSDFRWHSFGNNNYHRNIFDRVSGYAEVDFGYWKTRLEFNKPSSYSNLFFQFSFNFGSSSYNNQSEVIINQYPSASSTDYKITRIQLPHPIKVQKVKITLRYTLHNINWSYVNSNGSNFLYSLQIDSSYGSRFCIIGNNN